MSSSPSPDPLSRTLAAWRVNPSRNPEFRRGVWTRIEAASRPSTWSRFARAHPAAVALLLGVAIVTGAWSGRNEAQTRTDADRLLIAANYVHALDARSMRAP